MKISSLPPPHIDREGLEPIPVFVSADERYARYIAVVIASIMEQTQHAVAFHVLHYGITKATMRRLSEYCALYSHATITFHTIAIRDLEHLPTYAHFSLATYTRFYVADLVPTLEKAIYMDVDTCVVGDIAEIFYYDLKGYGLGAVSGDRDNPYLPESSWLIKHKEELMMHSDEFYFCAGLLLIDCTYWRTHNIKEQCLTYMNNAPSTFTHLDQDVLNLLFRGRYIALPPHMQYFASELTPNYQAYVTEELRRKQCSVIHYTSGKKPWNTLEETIFLSHIWWHYASLTPFYVEFMSELIIKQTHVVTTIARQLHRHAFYLRMLAYIKYKFSFGTKRKKYKDMYLFIKSI